MTLSPRNLVADALVMHEETVAKWHHSPIENECEGLMNVICQQHEFNYRLWHEEDVARSPYVGDMRIAEVKRAIDKFNQQRNDWIEQIDAHLIHAISESGVKNNPDAKLNTETPGSVFDRLSISALRTYHMKEQLDRDDVDHEHTQKVEQRIAICETQRVDLSNALVELLDDIIAGEKQLKVYKQLKMYNDPTLNPFLYKQNKAG